MAVAIGDGGPQIEEIDDDDDIEDTAKTWLWMQIWLAIKPHLKCTQFGKFKKEFEDKIALAEANIDGALEARSKVQAVYDGLAGQKNELSLALKSGGSAV